MTRVLIVDDDPDELRRTSALVSGLGYGVTTAAGGEAALATLRADSLFAAIIVDLVMPDRDGRAVLAALAGERFAPPVIVTITAPAPETVASLMAAGAADFIDKPATAPRLLAVLENARRRRALERALAPAANGRRTAPQLADIAARSSGMERALAVCRKAARSPLPLLIEGEAGSGRKYLARAVHGSGDRAGRPFVVFDCAAFPPERIEAELFGRRRGSALDLPGKVAEAHGGTLLLDEIGELPLPTQAAVLKLIETGECRPLGAARAERTQLRLIATSRRRLLNLARSGEIDAGLYNRLNVLPLYLPPLRERHEDLLPLTQHFLAVIAAEHGRRSASLSPAAMALLAAYDWPGNVRELSNALVRATALARSLVLEPADFPHLAVAVDGREAARAAMEAGAAASAPVHIDSLIALKSMERPAPDRFLTDAGELTPLATLERDLIVFALETHRGRMSKIARALGIGRSTLYRKLKDYGLDAGLEPEAGELHA